MGSVPTPLVVVGFDGTAESRLALTWAVEAASSRDAYLRVVFAYLEKNALGQLRTELDEALALAGERLGTGRVQGRLVCGSAAKVVLDAAVEADLIVLGARSRPDASELRGLLVAAVTARARCPVIVVRSGNWSDPILVGTDSSARCDGAVAFAFAEADRRALPLTVVYCWQPLRRDDEESAVARQRALLERWLTGQVEPHRETHPAVDVQVRVECGRPLDRLAALTPAYSLLVVGSHDRDEPGRLAGSVSNRLALDAACSVAIVPVS